MVNLIFVGIKLLLLLPIAGAAYELVRTAGDNADKWWIKPIIFPGLSLQKLTTRQPTDDQIEIALTALKSALKIEGLEATGQARVGETT